MKKRCIVMALVFCMVLSMITPAMAFEANDVGSEFWGIEAIQYLNELEIMNGYNGSFRPNDFITRVEYFTIINRAFGYERTDLAKKFKDVDYSKNDWKTLEIMKSSSQGFLQGSDGYVNADSNITREEAFAILSRVMKLDKNSGTTEFADDSKISDWAKQEICAMWRAGYIKGSDNKINPQGKLTRAEAAQAVYNAMGVLLNKAEEVDGANTAYNNVTISADGAILKNAVINGNLYITEGVGSGEVTLNNVEVKGRTLVSGGGVNSIKIRDSKIKDLIINVPTNDKVRVEVSGRSNLDIVSILSDAIFDLASSSSTVKTLNINSSAIVEGVGKIVTAYINASNVTIAQLPENIMIKDEIVALINGKEYSSSSSSSNSGSSSGGDDDVVVENAKVFDDPLATIDRQEYSTEKFTARPLIILMDFPNYPYTELDDNETDFRINAFNGEDTTPEFYESLFFGDDYYTTNDGNKHITVNKFFMEESGGTYEFKGDVFGWYTAPKDIEYYGYNDPEYWESDQKRASELVQVAIEELVKNNPDLDMSKYDVEDKWDIDNDGNYDEPDGIIDTVVVIHAGLGEEWGGGSVGADAIWPFRIGFSWYDHDINFDDPNDAAKLIEPDKNGNTPAYKFVDSNDKTWFAEDFTVFEQDLPVDLFVHEYGHVLGLPDLYASNGTPPVENWSVMGGSYTGDPRGSEPNSYGALCKKFLQEDFEKRGRTYARWQNSEVIDLEDIGDDGLDIVLDQASLKGAKKDSVIINLPKRKYPTVVSPKDGSYSYFSDNKNNMENYMTLKNGLDLRNITTSSAIVTSGSAITLSFDAWWNLDPGFDFFAVQAREKGTDNWKALKDTTGWTTDKVDDWVSKNETPEQILDRNPGWAISFSSWDMNGDGSDWNEWRNIKFDLSEFAGKEIELRFRIRTDDNTPEDGIFLDNILIANGNDKLLSDDVEGDLEFSLDGFSTSDGYELPTDHYYILEWRNSGADTLVDKGLQTINIGRPTLEYDPGLIVWYINDKYAGRRPDQNNKNHKNEQYAGIIDADQNPVWYKYEDPSRGEGPDGVNYQMHDAAFSLKLGTEILINGGADNNKYTIKDNHLFMKPAFSDSNDYTAIESEPKQYGVSLVEYGLKIFITDESSDRSTAKIYIAFDDDKNASVEQEQTIIKSIEFNNQSAYITTDKKYKKAFAQFVGKDGSKKEFELNYRNGRYYITDEFLAEDNDWQIEYVIFEDTDGNAKAIYNISINGIFGADFNKLIK